MRDKTLQERLRYAGAINDDADCFWVDSDLLREAADLIDRLTAAPSEDAVELVAEADAIKALVEAANSAPHHDECDLFVLGTECSCYKRRIDAALRPFLKEGE